MEKNDELPSALEQSQRGFNISRGGRRRIALRHPGSPNILFRAYFPLLQYGERLYQCNYGGVPTMNNTFLYIPDEFKDKRVLLTEGTKGPGEAIVRRFAQAGAVVATAATPPLPVGQKPPLFVQADLIRCRGI